MLSPNVELLLLRSAGHGDAVGPPAVSGAVARAGAARRARAGAHGGTLLLQLEHRLAPVGLRGLKVEEVILQPFLNSVQIVQSGPRVELCKSLLCGCG